MVRLLSIKISNLYSYDQIDTGPADKDQSVSFSNINVIVGPNDSGKSNIFRAIKLLVDTVRLGSTISDSDLFSNQAAPKLEAEFVLSDSEAGALLDFLSVYADPVSPPTALIFVHQFKNRKVILNLIKELRVEITWQPSNYASLFPTVTFHFEKLRLKIHTNTPLGQAFIAPDFPLKNGYRTQVKFPEFLDNFN